MLDYTLQVILLDTQIMRSFSMVYSVERIRFFTKARRKIFARGIDILPMVGFIAFFGLYN